MFTNQPFVRHSLFVVSLTSFHLSAYASPLTNGTPLTNLSGSTASGYTLEVPSGASNLVFTTSGGTGDADLYVKYGSAPTTSSYQCRSWNGDNKRLDMPDTVDNNQNIVSGTVQLVSPRRAVFKPDVTYYVNAGGTFDWNNPNWNGLKPNYRDEIRARTSGSAGVLQPG